MAFVDSKAREIRRFSGIVHVGIDGKYIEALGRVRGFGDAHEDPGSGFIDAAVGHDDEPPRKRIVEDSRVEGFRGRLTCFRPERGPERLVRNRPKYNGTEILSEDGEATVEEAHEVRGTGRSLGVRREEGVVVREAGKALLQGRSRRSDEERLQKPRRLR